MQFAVTLQLTPHPSLWSECYLYAGACALAANRHIALQIRTSAHPGSPNLVLLEVIHVSTGKRKLLAFDLYDRADLFNQSVLETCHSYFKRSYHQPLIPANASDHQDKIRPFGLPFPCQIAGSRGRVLRSILVSYLSHLIDAPHAIHRFRDDYQVLRQFLASPQVDLFIESPIAPKDQVVAFQTRLWEPSDTTDDAEAVNHERVSIVRALKKEFGPRFHGGIVPTPYALSNFPDAVTDQDCNRTRYVAQSKRALIGIYTRGLHHSIAYKFPEYLAASQCIVSTPLRNQLPQPLEPETHYLPFQTPDQCLAQCTRLLDNPDFATQMRHHNHDYFAQNVHPAAALLTALHQSFSPTPTPEPVASNQ